MQITDPSALHGREVRSTNGDKIGKVEGVFLDDETSQPEWVAVKTGMFGSSVSLVPIAAAEDRDGDLVVPFDKAQVKDAPHHDPEQSLSTDDEAELFDYYGVPYGGATATATGGPRTAAADAGAAPRTETRSDRAADTGVAEEPAAVGRDTSGPTTDDAMTRSEERLRVGTESVETGRARLRKYVVTENVTQTVPVTREEVRVEREPITDANRDQALSGPGISEEEHEVVLHAERPVVEKEAVSVERVRLAKEQVADQETVGGEVRKEQIETEGLSSTDETRRDG